MCPAVLVPSAMPALAPQLPRFAPPRQHRECVVDADLQSIGQDAFSLLDHDPAGQSWLTGLAPQ